MLETIVYFDSLCIQFLEKKKHNLFLDIWLLIG